MKKNFNWGTGILIVTILFFISLIVRVIISTTIPVDLITPEYYHNELNYNQHIEKEKHTNSLEQKIELSENEKEVILKFPDIVNVEAISGSILFYCPSKIDKDLTFKVEPGTDLLQKIEKSEFTEPRYVIQIDWQSDSITYYQEIDLNL
jgi:hypothetical protein